jgi:hypothetical protein
VAPHKWENFAANCYAQVQEVTPRNRFKHLNGEQNPADCPSRRVCFYSLTDHVLCWAGLICVGNDSSPQKTLKQIRELSILALMSSGSRPFGQLIILVSVPEIIV